MTRHQGFDVRVAPEVEVAMQKGGKELAVGFAGAMRHLRLNGTRSRSTKKLKGLDLWEIRFGDRRAFFRLVPHRVIIAVGFVAVKKAERLPMRRLRHIERVVRAWSDELEAGR